ncbi:MAG: DUF4440 domain-containing protein [Chthoniobacterales bacterium]
MKLFFFAGTALLPFFATSGAPAAMPATDPNARSLAAAETAFAHESETSGTRTAFLHALSRDGILFRPDPENGLKSWETKKGSGGLLQWQPVLAVVAGSGDFGYTTGPWTYKKSAQDKAEAFGHFVSIWRKEEGKWKVLFDLGTDHPAPPETPALQMFDNHAPNEPAAAALAALLQQDRVYAAAPASQFSAVAADAVRLHWPDKLPVIGKEAVAAMLQAAPRTITFDEPKGDVAASGDLGFAWGKYSAKEKTGTAAPEIGYYLRIWRKNEAGKWQLALDLLHPR